MSIFVQLDSYKNFDLVPTITDCLNKADDKNGLRFGVVLQQDEEIPSELNMPNLSAHRVSLADSKGHSWAMSVAQSFYKSEDFILKVDSGSRFAESWDTKLIQALNSINKEKAILTNCPNKINNQELEIKDVSYRLQPHMFIKKTPFCWASPMKGIKEIVPARIICNYFMFTVGSHSKDCKYNPNLYWEEIDSEITIRSFTSGYDIYNHYVPIVWRNYARPHHWDDHNDWWLSTEKSEKTFIDLISGKQTEFSLGKERSLEDYQKYSGLDYQKRRIHRDVLGTNKNPPVEYSDDQSWENSMTKDHSITVSWDTNEIEKCDDYDYWYFAVEDQDGNNIVRNDLRHERDASTLEFKTNYRKIFFKTTEGKIPSNICIWPVSKSKGWLKKSKFPIN